MYNIFMESNESFPFGPGHIERLKEINEPSEIKPNWEVVAVIGPDVKSMDKFVDTLEVESIDAIGIIRDIPDRIVADEEGRHAITEKTEPIVSEIAIAIKEAMARGHKVISISCNNMSIEEIFIGPVRQKLSDEGFEEGEDFILMTPVQALLREYNMNSERAPMVIGTILACEHFPEEQFDTLHHAGYFEELDIVQEIVSRVKATNNMHVHPKLVEKYKEQDQPLSDRIILDARLIKMVEMLKARGITEVTLGCTELPIAFVRLDEIMPDHGIKTVDPAVLVAKHAQKEVEEVAKRKQ